MTETFTWRATADSSGDGEFRVKSANFGDGYKQEVGDGINNEVQKWNVSVVGSHAEIQAVLDFIRLHAGVTSFFWTPPWGMVGYYKCKTYRMPTDQGGDVATMTMTFEQGFMP